jgi:hypothetical protein
LLELKNIWNLAKTGFVNKEERRNKELVFFVLNMLLILAIFKLLSIGLTYLLVEYNIIEIPPKLPNLRFDNFGPFEKLFWVAIFAPIAEELAFRLPLKFTKWNFIISVMGLSLVIVRVLAEMEYLYCFLIITVVGILCYFFLQPIRLKFLEDFWIKNRLTIFYFFLFTFALVHLKSYEITTDLLLLSPIIILPKVLGALVYSYIRLSSGILLAICFHAFNNGIFDIVTIIADYFSEFT